MPVLHSEIESLPSTEAPLGLPDRAPDRLMLRVLPLATHLGVLTMLAGGASLVAFVLASFGFSTAAFAVAAMAGALYVMIVVAFVTNRGRKQSVQRDLRRAQTIFARDPNAIFLTTLSGRPLARNEASEAQTAPELWFQDWCIDPTAMISDILDDVRREGAWTKNFSSDTRLLQASAVLFGPKSEVVVWRFNPVRLSHGNRFDSLDVPVLSQRGDTLEINTFAADLAPVSDWEAALASRDATGSLITLWGDQPAQAIPINRRPGLEDILILPPTSAQSRTDAASADFEEIPVALIKIDPTGKIVGTNRIARQLLAYDAGDSRYFWQIVEGLGRPVSDWLEDARAGRALGRPEVLQASLATQETYVQIILRRAGGLGNDGGLVAVISDATEMKSLEARFVQSQKMQAIGQLAGGIAHDFNNLLTAISGHCDLLLMNRDRFDPDYSDLLQIHQNANRAAALVRQLLAFSRKQTMKTELLHLESLLEDLTHLLTRLVGERINLHLAHDPDICAIRADKRQLEQVLMNLVVNARDAMPMGGAIRVRTESVHLTEELEVGRARLPPGDYARIRVIDEGLGIPAAIIDKIFEPFFTTKRQGEGTGLGLSTAYGIVKQMGGFIFAQSVEGSGTEFSLYFASAGKPNAPAAQRSEPANGAPPRSDLEHIPDPRLRAPQSDFKQGPAPKIDGSVSVPAAHPPPLPAAPTRNGTILLVEDEAPVRAFAARALRLQGYQVFEAQDGEQALEFLNDIKRRIDYFVTDVIMPGIDGPGWVNEALAARPDTPVVFMSGYTEDTVSAALKTVPNSAFLGKPFSLQELTETIDGLARA